MLNATQSMMLVVQLPPLGGPIKNLNQWLGSIDRMVIQITAVFDPSHQQRQIPPLLENRCVTVVNGQRKEQITRQGAGLARQASAQRREPRSRAEIEKIQRLRAAILSAREELNNAQREDASREEQLEALLAAESLVVGAARSMNLRAVISNGLIQEFNSIREEIAHARKADQPKPSSSPVETAQTEKERYLERNKARKQKLRARMAWAGE